MTKWKERKVSGLWAGLRFCAGCVGFRAWSLRIDSKMVSPFAGRSHLLAHYCSFRPEPVCDANLQTVTDPCWFRNLIQAVVIEEQVLTEVTDQPILLSQTQGVKRYTFKLLIFVSEKSFNRKTCYRSAKRFVTSKAAVLTFFLKLNPLTSLRSRKQ